MLLKTNPYYAHRGIIQNIIEGGIISDVEVELDGGETIHAMVSNVNILNQAFSLGDTVYCYIKPENISLTEDMNEFISEVWNDSYRPNYNLFEYRISDITIGPLNEGTRINMYQTDNEYILSKKDALNALNDGYAIDINTNLPIKSSINNGLVVPSSYYIGYPSLVMSGTIIGIIEGPINDLIKVDVNGQCYYFLQMHKLIREYDLNVGNDVNVILSPFGFYY